VYRPRRGAAARGFPQPRYNRGIAIAGCGGGSARREEAQLTTLLQTLVAGLVGTSLMSFSMTAVHRSGWANADMVRALGSLVTRSLERALGWGLLIHNVSGVLFAIPYAAVLGALAGSGALLLVGLGAMLGFAHGLVVSLLLLAVVAEKHPLERFRKAGFEVAVAHILGHVAYGVGVASVVGLLGIDWGLRL
jgi:hypothetical protein